MIQSCLLLLLRAVMTAARSADGNVKAEHRFRHL